LSFPASACEHTIDLCSGRDLIRQTDDRLILGEDEEGERKESGGNGREDFARLELLNSERCYCLFFLQGDIKYVRWRSR